MSVFELVALSGNWATDYDGIIISGGTWRASHTTFSNHGVSIYLGDNGNAIFTNTILVNQGLGITVTEGSKAWLNGVLWYNNGLNYGGPGAITVTREVIGPPAFAVDGYHLTSASAAIDRGLVTDVATDIDGKPRFVGLAPDLGVHEYPEVVRPLRFYLTGIYLHGGQPATRGAWR